MAYPRVSIKNSIPYVAWGTVTYPGCRSDDHYTTPFTTWTAPRPRGLCLVSRITATVRTPGGDIEATPYTSSGTSHSRFAIIQTGERSFQVTRIVSALEDEQPEGPVEATTEQNEEK